MIDDADISQQPYHMNENEESDEEFVDDEAF